MFLSIREYRLWGINSLGCLMSSDTTKRITDSFAAQSTASALMCSPNEIFLTFAEIRKIAKLKREVKIIRILSMFLALIFFMLGLILFLSTLQVLLRILNYINRRDFTVKISKCVLWAKWKREFVCGVTDENFFPCHFKFSFQFRLSFSLSVSLYDVISSASGDPIFH